MRTFLGLLWALGGAVGGFILAALAAMVFANATNMSSREGESGYFMIALGLIGAVIGLVVGLLLYARSAPSGQGAAFISSGTMGVIGVIAAIALSIWTFMSLREAPLEYDGALANLEMEFRVPTAQLPTTDLAQW